MELPTTLFLACLVSGLAGLAALLRSGKPLTWLGVLSAFLNSGLLGLGLAMVWATQFQETPHTLVGICVLVGLGGMPTIDFLLGLLQKGGLSITFQNGILRTKDKESTMTTRQLGEHISLHVQESIVSHDGTFTVILRVFLYSLGLALCMWTAGAYFADTWTANIGLFTLFASALELLWAGTNDSRRYFWYCLCVLLLFFAGTLLVGQVAKVQGAGTELKSSQVR